MKWFFVSFSEQFQLLWHIRFCSFYFSIISSYLCKLPVCYGHHTDISSRRQSKSDSVFVDFQVLS